MSNSEETNTAINNINIEKGISFIFIIIGVANIIGDNLLIEGTKNNDQSLKDKASTVFLWGLILSFIIYIVIVARNYNDFKQKKASGLDATPEQQRLFGSVLILIGFIIIFDFFLKNSFNTDNPPVF